MKSRQKLVVGALVLGAAFSACSKAPQNEDIRRICNTRIEVRRQVLVGLDSTTDSQKRGMLLDRLMKDGTVSQLSFEHDLVAISILSESAESGMTPEATKAVEHLLKIATTDDLGNGITDHVSVKNAVGGLKRALTNPNLDEASKNKITELLGSAEDGLPPRTQEYDLPPGCEE